MYCPNAWVILSVESTLYILSLYGRGGGGREERGGGKGGGGGGGGVGVGVGRGVEEEKEEEQHLKAETCIVIPVHNVCIACNVHVQNMCTCT